jgi:hypothetical protein
LLKIAMLKSHNIRKEQVKPSTQESIPDDSFCTNFKNPQNSDKRAILPFSSVKGVVGLDTDSECIWDHWYALQKFSVLNHFWKCVYTYIKLLKFS